MKPFLFWTIFLVLAFPCAARLVPYVASLAEADAIAIVTVTTCEQDYSEEFVHQSATLTVDTAIKGLKVGERFRESFGTPYKPGKFVEGKYSSTTTLRSESLSFQIAERYLVLLKHKKDQWIVTRASCIIDDLIGDGYFDESVGAQGVPVSKAIELLRAYTKTAEKEVTAQRP